MHVTVIVTRIGHVIGDCSHRTVFGWTVVVGIVLDWNPDGSDCCHWWDVDFMYVVCMGLILIGKDRKSGWEDIA